MEAGMGTSISHRSPPTPGWNAVAASYTAEGITIPRIVQELWRAASSQPLGNLPADLCHPLIPEIAAIASSSTDRAQAIQEARRLVATAGVTSLGLDIAHRALVQAFSMPGDRTQSFAQALFAQAANYLVSRDLPGFVGRAGRAQNVSEAIDLKNDLTEQTASIVRGTPMPPSALKDSTSWRSFVESVVERLAGRLTLA
jgi:hypothetical protein